MATPEKAFLIVLILLGVCFQVRLWRDWRGRKYRKGFYLFGLAFCGVIEALAADALWVDKIGHRGPSVAIPIFTALACLSLSFWVAYFRSSRSQHDV